LQQVGFCSKVFALVDTYLYSVNFSSCCDADINECQTDNGGCTQTCNNTDGSYQCYCWDGYELTSDEYICVGKDNIVIAIVDYNIA